VFSHGDSRTASLAPSVEAGPKRLATLHSTVTISQLCCYTDLSIPVNYRIHLVKFRVFLACSAVQSRWSGPTFQRSPSSEHWMNEAVRFSETSVYFESTRLSFREDCPLHIVGGFAWLITWNEPINNVCNKNIQLKNTQENARRLWR
jgi:hypothetical protein